MAGLIDVPRLVVVSEVAPERTAGGGLVLHRLLRNYPRERLLVITIPPDYWPGPVERLPGVEYREIQFRIPRWIWNRFNPFWPLFMAKYIRRYQADVVAAIGDFRPTAVLSVSHNYLWFVADSIAKRLDIPFHLIIHDDWPSLQTLSQPEWIRPLVRRACERVYTKTLRRAANRFVVSPGMKDRYAERYRTECKVLYPSRGEDSPIPRLVDVSAEVPLVVAYAGMIHQSWTAESLRSAAEVLSKLGGRLDLYTPYSAEKLSEWGLNAPNVRHVGFFSAAEMADMVGATAQILFLPASFGERERVDVLTLFPSKLADYTAIGLPILIWGPAYSSAARWAAENRGTTELVTDPDPTSLRMAIERLMNPDYARSMATAGVAAGIRDFSPETVRRIFLESLMRGDHSIHDAPTK